MKIRLTKDINRSIQARNIFFNKGLDNEKSGDLKKALEFYRMAIKIDNNFFDSWLNAGAVYSQLGKRKKAIICYQRALVSQRDKRAYYNLGSEYFRCGKYPEAKTALTRSIKLDKKFVSAHLLLSYTYGKLGDDKKAEVSVKNVLILDPANKQAMTALALLYFHSDRENLSRKLVDKLKVTLPNNTVIKRLNANLNLAEGDIVKSIIDFKDLAQNDTKLHELNKIMHEKASAEQKTNIKKKKQQLQLKETKNSKDLFELSLLSFFDGKPQIAMDYLLEASNKSQSN